MQMLHLGHKQNEGNLSNNNFNYTGLGYSKKQKGLMNTEYQTTVLDYRSTITDQRQ